AYQIRQSFKPGEVTPEEANQVGYETAMRWTKGKHAFIVATHIEKAHIHNHIIYNSTTVDGSRKFDNFFLSGLAVQKLSDRVCAEHGLSIITPKPYRERVKRTDYPKRRSHRDELCEAIDTVLTQKPKSFEDFIQVLADMGFEFKDGKQPAFRGKEQKRFIRLRSLGDGYSEEELRAVISGKSLHKTNSRKAQSKQFNLLIDIEAKMAEGKSVGYEKWAKKFNRKEAARTVCLLKEKGIGNYEALIALTDKLSSRFSELSDSIKDTEKRIIQLQALLEHMDNYYATRQIYVEYRKAGYSKKFFEEHRQEITLHKAAKKAFDELNLTKLPLRKSVYEEIHQLTVQKKKDYAEYRQVKKDMQEYLIAKQTVETILNIDKKKEPEKEQEKKSVR
ncbi:MAG: relaxase/mobilization nuclease domain-containing protein, partial [Erysipelotrichaceae bacterium]|nr:relaxase/mobilization nuclease domain-containing protein [Erysipelotrichaceae bacterium]